MKKIHNSKFSRHIKFYVSALILMMIANVASAHYIWIETGSSGKIGQPQEVKIYYGEYNEGKREIKGGRLDELKGIEAWLIDPDGNRTALKVSLEDKFFKTAFTPSKAGEYYIMAVNKVVEVKDWSKHDIGIVKPMFYASKKISVQTNVHKPLNVLELPDLTIVPVENKNSKEPSFKLYFKGLPLSNGKVFFHAPNEWSKELKTDNEGIVSFNPLWKGLYVIECIHVEKTPGKFKDKNYEAIRHRATSMITIE